MPHVEDVIVRALGAAGLRRSARSLLSVAPRWLQRLSTRDIRTRVKLVREDVLGPIYEDVIALLAADVGELGDYLEFGVYNGTSMCCMHRALDAAGNRRTRLIGFDSFEGLPPSAATDSGGHWRPGEFASSLEFTSSVLDHERVDWSRVRLVKGYFEETLTPSRFRQLAIAKASIIMIDCDLYQSTREALTFCTPAIVDRSVILFDDWYPLANSNLGEKKAFDEWLVTEPTLAAEPLLEFPPYGKAFSVRRVGPVPTNPLTVT